MKSLIIYYIKILLPVPIIVFFANMELTWIFFALLGLYLLIYRAIIDGDRLMQKGSIDKSERWKLFIPFWRLRYLEELYFSP
jgi:hypothetical protein